MRFTHKKLSIHSEFKYDEIQCSQDTKHKDWTELERLVLVFPVGSMALTAAVLALKPKPMMTVTLVQLGSAASIIEHVSYE